MMYVDEWVSCADAQTGPLDSFTWRGEQTPSAAPYGTLVIIREDDVRKQVEAHYDWYNHLMWAVDDEPRVAPAMVSAISGSWRSSRRARRYENRIEDAGAAVFPNQKTWAKAVASRLLFAIQWPHPRLFEYHNPAAVGAGAMAATATLTAASSPNDPLEIAVDALDTSSSDASDVRKTINEPFSTAALRRVIDARRDDF